MFWFETTCNYFQVQQRCDKILENKFTDLWFLFVFTGPIASIFVNKYGCRAVTIAGAILAGLSLLASTFANSVIMLYVTIGFGTGI